ncbi:MAG: sigma-54 dependent transcriptional regulator [Paracoccaceae bacterium]
MSEKLTVAIIDDESDMRDSISQWLGLSGFQTMCFESAKAALDAIGSDFKGIVLSDIRMPGMDGMELLKRLHALDSSLPVIMITGHGDVQMAVEAMRIGAYDFVEKPFDPERLADLARHAIQSRRLTLDNRALRRELSDGSILLRKLMGNSPQVEKLREDILDLAQADGNIMITGETGTGKSLISHAIHACGARQGRPLFTVNCAALDEQELNARLFGPALTAENRPVMGTNTPCTLCLEDVHTLPETTQARLLAALEEMENDSADDGVNMVRIFSVSGQSSEETQKNLRSDLYYRLAGMELPVPSLRERGEDILILFTRFTQLFAEDYGCDVPEMGAQDAASLLQADWPGNIRQLQNLAERAVLQARRGEAGIATLLAEEGLHDGNTDGAEKPLKEHVEAFERMLIENALRRNRGSVASVMEELALPRRTLNEKMAKYGLSRADYV